MRPAEKNEENKVLLLILQKDHSGIKVLFDTYGPVIYGAVVRIVGDQMIAEQILSATLIRIYHDIADFKPEFSSFFTWVMNIARSLAKDHIFADGKTIEAKEHKSIFDLVINQGFSIETVATLRGISTASCAMELRKELKKIITK